MILEPVPFIAGLLFVVRTAYRLREYWLYKTGEIRKDAIVQKVIWKRAGYMRFSYLFDKESPVITYQFNLNGNRYEKTEEAFMQFIKGAIREGSVIKIYIPKGNNKDKVTIINPIKNKDFWGSILIFLMGLMLIAIAFLAKL